MATTTAPPATTTAPQQVAFAPKPGRGRPHIRPPRGGNRNHAMVTRYQQDLRMFPSWLARVGVAVALLLIVVTPYQLADDWLLILIICGCYAIGAIGLNLLTGYTGQVSLGHAFFVAAGGYTVAHLSADLTASNHIVGTSTQPLIVWLLASALIGAVLGALIGPFALRLQGNYLAIVTLALLFFSSYLFKNWTSVTGGGDGLNFNPAVSIGPIDFNNLSGVGFTSRMQGLFWLVWGLVALAALLAKNLTRTRPGRAMQAVRDRDVAAEICGVSLLRYKLGAFAVSSAFAAVGGALLIALTQGHIEPAPVSGVQGLVLSITFVAIVIVGGLGTVWGSIIGAIVVEGLPQLINRYSSNIPFIGSNGIISVDSFNNLLFGVLIVLFLLLEPRGLAAVWQRAKGYFKSWPFSY